MLVWILAAALLMACAYVALTPKDVDPYFITHQASISATRLRGESAVFRSLSNEHGRALLGSMRPLNEFRLRSLWEEAASFRITYVARTGRLSPVADFPALVARVARAIEHYPPNCEVPMAFDVGVEALVAFFAVVLSGRIPKLCPTAPGDDSDAEPDAEPDETGRPAPADAVVLRQAEFKFPHGANGIVVRVDADTSRVIPILDGASSETRGGGSDGAAGMDVADTPATSDVLRATGRRAISQVDLGVAIAGQMTALGAQYRWTQNDSVFVAPGPLTAYAITAMLTALSSRAQLVFAEPDPLMTATTVLQRAKPTVLVSDDVSMRSLAKHVNDFQLASWMRYGLRRVRLMRGALTRPGMMPGFASVRLLHTASGSDPFQWLDNAEMADLRALSGTQVIHVYTPEDGLPVSQTVVGDYRAGKKLPGALLGPPLPGLELKKRGAALLVLRANHDEWRAIGAEVSEGSQLARDGCLYIPAKRHDFSAEYFYTGELK